MSELKERLKQLLAQGKTEKVIQDLLELVTQADRHPREKEIRLLSAKFQQFSQDKRIGVISNQEFDLSLQKMNLSILEVIDKISENELDNNLSLVNFRSNWWKWITGLGIVLGLLLFLIMMSDIGDGIFVKKKARVTPLQLTVYVHGPNSKQEIVLENEGELVVDFGNRRGRRVVGEFGRTNFGEIDQDFVGQEIGLYVEAEGFERIHPDSTYIFTGQPIYLAVRQIELLNVGVQSGDNQSNHSQNIQKKSSASETKLKTFSIEEGKYGQLGDYVEGYVFRMNSDNKVAFGYTGKILQMEGTDLFRYPGGKVKIIVNDHVCGSIGKIGSTFSRGNLYPDVEKEIWEKIDLIIEKNKIQIGKQIRACL